MHYLETFERSIMKYRYIPGSDLKVPLIGQGTMGIGGYFTEDNQNDNSYINLIRYGIDLGATFIDTAENYGAGHSEELIGKAVKNIRSQVYIATKFLPEHSSYNDVIKAAENSLKRLTTDYIDLYQLHWPNYNIPLEETAKALIKLVKNGKVKYIGACNCSITELKQLQNYLGEVPLLFIQHEYNLLERSVETSILPYCHQYNKLFIAYSPLLRGALNSIDGGLKTLLLDYNISISQFALLWILQHPSTIVIPYTSSKEHMRDNISVTDLDISELLSQVDNLLPTIQEIPVSLIKVLPESDRPVYISKQEALDNKFGLEPSPSALAAQITGGCFFKPVKVKKEGNDYILLDGRTKFWAWVIAYNSERAIPTHIIEEKR